MPDSPSPAADGPVFPAIEREASLASRVTSHLEGLIVDNQLRPGDRLPSERHLAQQFGVSRTVIREAVRSLAARGLLDVRSGSGTVVGALPFDSAAESMGLLLNLGITSGRIDLDKVMEVRRMLEVEIAGLAACHATPQDIASLVAILSEAESGFEDEETFVRTDVAFHAALARATQNELFLVLLASIGDVLVQLRHLGWRTPGAATRALAYHRKVLESVKAGDVNGARQAMDAHMDEARETGVQGLHVTSSEPSRSQQA
jgi:GntR family transcriptional regulator, transcriptional repressor for pyruvate dehydrogenase complex